MIFDYTVTNTSRTAKIYLTSDIYFADFKTFVQLELKSLLDEFVSVFGKVTCITFTFFWIFP